MSDLSQLCCHLFPILSLSYMYIQVFCFTVLVVLLYLSSVVCFFCVFISVVPRFFFLVFQFPDSLVCLLYFSTFSSSLCICCPKYLYNFIRLHVFQNSSSFEPFTASSTSYILVMESRSWSEAQSYCRTYHTDLTSIRSKEETSNITLTLNGSGVQYVWIGLYRDHWAFWSDNTTSTFTNWEPSQPNNYNSAQYCVTMYFMSGKWSDSACPECKHYKILSSCKTLMFVLLYVVHF
uniref:C-type lectin domain-containing protein n=1 Tax=Oreochromis aureus TaxID=47969 RepID=A0A668RGB4_OREAU